MESHGDTIARKVASSGLLLALAVLFGYVEAIIPVPMPVPGMKLGLANIVIVTIHFYHMTIKVSQFLDQRFKIHHLINVTKTLNFIIINYCAKI